MGATSPEGGGHVSKGSTQPIPEVRVRLQQMQSFTAQGPASWCCTRVDRHNGCSRRQAHHVSCNPRRPNMTPPTCFLVCELQTHQGSWWVGCTGAHPPPAALPYHLSCSCRTTSWPALAAAPCTRQAAAVGGDRGCFSVDTAASQHTSNAACICACQMQLLPLRCYTWLDVEDWWRKMEIQARQQHGCNMGPAAGGVSCRAPAARLVAMHVGHILEVGLWLCYTWFV